MHQIILYFSKIIFLKEYKNQSIDQLMIRLEMKTANDSNREAAKISALSSGKIDKNEYLLGE